MLGKKPIWTVSKRNQHPQSSPSKSHCFISCWHTHLPHHWRFACMWHCCINKWPVVLGPWSQWSTGRQRRGESHAWDCGVAKRGAHEAHRHRSLRSRCHRWRHLLRHATERQIRCRTLRNSMRRSCNRTSHRITHTRGRYCSWRPAI